MATVDHNAVWSVAVATMGIIGYVYGWMSHPKHRKGCNECDAVIRREAEAAIELAHDVLHKGYGFKRGAPDRVDCDDPLCHRNRNIQNPDDQL